jgi:hypothetical protein
LAGGRVDSIMIKNRFLLRAFALSQVWSLAVLPTAAEDHVVFQFVQAHCVVCHSTDGLSDELNLQELRDVRTFVQQREIWELVAEKVRSREMPPPGEPGPGTDEALAFVGWLRKEFERQDLAIPPQAGRVTARRLNRAEYIRTIRDLLGVDIEPTASFPTDPSAYGFDNISDALRLSSVLLEKYLDTAEIAVRIAIFGPLPQKPAVTHYPVPVRINTPRGQVELPADLFDYDYSGLSTVHSAHVIHRFPVDGEYSFRLVLNGHRPNQSEPARPALFVDGRFVEEAEVDATDLEGQVVDLKAWVTAGEHLLSASYLKTYHGLPASYGGPEPSKRPAIPLLSKNARGELTPEDIEVLRKFGTRIKTDAIEARVDNRFESIAVRGPLEQKLGASAESREKIFGADFADQQPNNEHARAIIGGFIERAFRRPVSSEEVDAYLTLFEMARREGDDFEEAIAVALQAILIAPDFLYRIERSVSSDDGDRSARGEHSVPVSEYELASRLSYFLWSSMPDAELFRMAAEGQLRNPDVLEIQVRRMLRDEKAQALVENFFGQWLQFRNVELVQPDPGRFPEFEESLRRSMRKETEHFLTYLLREDRSILEMLDADYSFVDERLARFYGIPDVQGPEFRRVDVGERLRGGGILSHASILTLSSYSTRTSPVLRGKWILETLLNAPPPPPPPSVPELNEANLGETVSLREELEAHRRDPACASCHARMDPLGFGLEHFNAIGAWRDEDGKYPVDASGTLPGGQSFRGHVELMEILKEDRDAIVRGLTEKLLIYALGRGLEGYDRPAVRSIVSSLPDADYRFSDLILGIVNSLPFQMRNATDNSDSAVSTEEDRE